MKSEINTAPAQSLRVTLLAKLLGIATRKIWLPRIIYTLIPFFYLFTGGIALLSALYLPGWGWFIPYGLLAAGISLHVTALIGLARYRGHRNSYQAKYPPKYHHSSREEPTH